jgi:hypothetical protein
MYSVSLNGINVNLIPRIAIFTIALASLSCSTSFAEEKMLNGSARHSQSMSSSVKLMRPVEVVAPIIRAAPQLPVNSYLRVTAVDPNATIPVFNRVKFSGPVLKPLPVRAPTPVATVNALNANQNEQATGRPSLSGTSNSTHGIVNLNPQYQTTAKTGANLPGQQAVAQSANWQMKSKAKLLTQPLQTEVRSANWNDWYKRVCQTVYDQWIINETGPGKVCVQVTVWSSRNIEGRILRFDHAPDSVRTSAQQIVFSKAALQAVNSLENNGILEFPVNDRRTKIVFDLDISRLVGGVSGCQVVASPASN